MNTLPIHRYQFNCQAQSALALNDYSGSMLRGAFGHALRELSCVTKMSDCKQCMLYRQCSYPAIFEPPVAIKSTFQDLSRIPSPYIIEPPSMGEQRLEKGEQLSFHIVLIGEQANSLLAQIIAAFETALQRGLGRQQGIAQLNDVSREQQGEQVIYRRAQDKLTPDSLLNPVSSETDKINIQLLSPLRIQQRKRLLVNNMQGKDFLGALVRRYYLLLEFYSDDYQAPDFSSLRQQAEQVEAHPQFTIYRYARYSSRQKHKMKLDTVLGDIQLKGNLQAFFPLLHLGQWLHIGSNTSFGLGQYLLNG